MKHVHTSTATAAGAAIGLVAGAGSMTLLTDAPEPKERIVEVQTTVPDEQDPLVQWLKQHPRRR